MDEAADDALARSAMRQPDGLNQAVIREVRNSRMPGEGMELADDPCRDLGNLKGMGQARPAEIAVAEIEDLGLALQTPERGGMNDAGVIDVEFRPGVFGLRRPAGSTFQPLRHCFPSLR